jgi:hypothetical protein
LERGKNFTLSLSLSLNLSLAPPSHSSSFIYIVFFSYSDDELLFLTYYTFFYSGGYMFVPEEFDASLEITWNIIRVSTLTSHYVPPLFTILLLSSFLYLLFLFIESTI